MVYNTFIFEKVEKLTLRGSVGARDTSRRGRGWGQLTFFRAEIFFGVSLPYFCIIKKGQLKIKKIMHFWNTLLLTAN